MNLSPSTVLSPEELRRVHAATLEVLEKAGVAVGHPELVQRLLKAGARAQGQVVRLPAALVERCLKLAPPLLHLHSRDGRPPLEIGRGETRAVSGFDGTFLLDPATGGRRPITLREVGDFAWIADRLADIDIVGIQGIPQDVPQSLAEAHAVAELLANTGKHLLIAPDTGQAAERVYAILREACGGQLAASPPVSCHISPSAPLRWTPEACDVILATVQSGIPFYILPAPMAGATSPVTLAGYLVQHNAQVLSGVVIAELLAEGHPLVYCAAPTLFNMREGNPLIATPETMLLRVGLVQLARFYGLPSHSIGFDTDAHVVDQQASWEKALTALAGVQAGVDVMVNLGMLSTGLTVSYESLLLDHELFGLLKRYRRGIEVDEETLAVDLITRVGTWGSFLEEEHTARHFRTENWYPQLSCRALLDRWKQAGSPEALMSASGRVREMLGEKRKSYLEPSASASIQRLLSR